MTETKSLTRFQRWLDALPTTNWKLWWGVVLMVALVSFDVLAVSIVLAVYLWAGLEGRALDLHEPPLVSELVYSAHAAVLGFLGVGYLQFGKKRDTYAAPSPDSERADVPASPAPTSPVEAAKPAEATTTPAKAAPPAATASAPVATPFYTPGVPASGYDPEA